MRPTVTDQLSSDRLMKATAFRLAEVGAEHPGLAVSALTDAVAMLDHWPAGVGLTIDLDVGMHRTAGLPAVGDLLALVPRHVCPTVNLFDSAILLDAGRAPRVLPVTARGRESSPTPSLPRERL